MRRRPTQAVLLYERHYSYGRRQGIARQVASFSGGRHFLLSSLQARHGQNVVVVISSLPGCGGSVAGRGGVGRAGKVVKCAQEGEASEGMVVREMLAGRCEGRKEGEGMLLHSERQLKAAVC